MSQVYKGLVKPKRRANPDDIIIHLYTNDLSSNTPAELLAESIVELASTLKSVSCNVTISNVTMGNDKHRKKVVQVNQDLKKLCQERNFQMINHRTQSQENI